ncbi:MAG: hypothetical protein AAF543_01485 [Pseudomonadota bacterium]
MNDNSASFQDHPSLDDRQAAERKLCRLFKSFGVDALARSDRLITPYLDRAAAFWRPHSGADFAALALEEAKADLETWFAALLAGKLEDRTDAIMTGRAAYLLCNGTTKWADQLLAPLGSLPEAFVDALIDHAPSAVPPSDLGEMHHQPYEAWSPASSVLRALPANGGLMQGLTGFLRRDAA